MMLRIGLGLVLAMASLAGVARAEGCGDLAALALPQGTVTEAASIAKGGEITTVNGVALTAPMDFCRVQAVSRPTADSEIRIEVWVPDGAAWNHKFEQVGNGGFAGSVPTRAMLRVLALGYAVAGTDDGHQSTEGTDASWALNHPEKIVDYGWRAISETTRTAKLVIARLTSRSPERSYFQGCSDGGREALMMAQRFPDYFDGIIAGAPANNMTRLLTQGKLRGARLSAAEGYALRGKLALLQAQALRQCGQALGGQGLGYLRDPMVCHVNLAPLTCADADAENCLTKAQADAVRAFYQDGTDPATGAPLHGLMPGAEAVKGGWEAWVTGSDPQHPAIGRGFAWNYFAYMVRGDATLDLATVTDADLARAARQYAPIMDSDSPDLSAFKARGGKLIQYHGWNDPAIPPGYSLEYQARVGARMGDVSDFSRLYMVPGMLHCGGGDAPTVVDWQAALEAWVERGQAPQNLTATDGKGASETLAPYHGAARK